ncbi:hypothetical protein CCGE531_13085 [Rhizobium sp. CCGE531]|nr:hypothetical protein CCGE531_13085 [Rhizobium sp. CCGE531]AYG73210.1 hypothetical protein CCGE532_12505 [Rhizobium sp. CCGE532]
MRSGFPSGIERKQRDRAVKAEPLYGAATTSYDEEPKRRFQAAFFYNPRRKGLVRRSSPIRLPGP